LETSDKLVLAGYKSSTGLLHLTAIPTERRYLSNKIKCNIKEYKSVLGHYTSRVAMITRQHIETLALRLWVDMTQSRWFLVLWAPYYALVYGIVGPILHRMQLI
jgi:hypothetical protein